MFKFQVWTKSKLLYEKYFGDSDRATLEVIRYLSGVADVIPGNLTVPWKPATMRRLGEQVALYEHMYEKYRFVLERIYVR